MANKTLFRSLIGKLLPKTNVINEAGGSAYPLSPQHGLAQLAATGCLGETYYVSAEVQLEKILALCETVSPEFIARTALYARQKGHMKDMPALLCAVLSVKGPGLLAEVFDRVIDNTRMLRNFVQILRSGVVGRKSLGTLPKWLVQSWLARQSDEKLFIGSIGDSPSLADVIRLAHPKPHSESRAALYRYILDRDYDEAALPELVRQYIKFKRNTNPGKVRVPDVPFQMLTSLKLTLKDWEQIARNASWQTTRMNLNTFQRHQVLDQEELVNMIANRLRNPDQIERARVLPYQLLAAYRNIGVKVPAAIREALQDALEISIRNVPRVSGRVFVCLDISGSMHGALTGVRKGATSKIRCIDVAALIAAAILRKNHQAEVIPFESEVVEFRVNPRDSVMTNAERLSKLPCGGTNCSAPLRYLNQRGAQGDLVVYVSDNESWVDAPHYGHWGGSATATLQQWQVFKRRSPAAKLVCIDLQPNTSTQAAEREDIVNIGGFSDQVFQLLADVAADRFTRDHWVAEIEKLKV